MRQSLSAWKVFKMLKSYREEIKWHFVVAQVFVIVFECNWKKRSQEQHFGHLSQHVYQSGCDTFSKSSVLGSEKN